MENCFKLVGHKASDADLDIDMLEFTIIMYNLCGFAPAGENAVILKADLGDDDTGALSINSGKVGIRGKLWLLIEEPGSSRLASAISVFIMFLVFYSCLMFAIESLPEMKVEPYLSSWGPLLKLSEVLCVVVFTIEYVVRLAVVPGTVLEKIRYVLTFMQIVDLLAILPFYIEIVLPSDDSSGGAGGGEQVQFEFLKILRLTRVARVIKVSRYLVWVQLLVSAGNKSLVPLGMTCGLIIVFVVLFGRCVIIPATATSPPTSLIVGSSIVAYDTWGWCSCDCCTALVRT